MSKINYVLVFLVTLLQNSSSWTVGQFVSYRVQKAYFSKFNTGRRNCPWLQIEIDYSLTIWFDGYKSKEEGGKYRELTLIPQVES